jgi:hypothetical protein
LVHPEHSERQSEREITAKFVPPLLSEEQKKYHVTMCHKLQVRLGRDPELLSKTTTGEMMGYYWYDPDTTCYLNE